MKQLRLPIFSSKIKMYNLRIVPPEPIFDRVMEFKKQFEAVFGKQPLSRSRPHITLASFRMNSKYQDDLVQMLNQLPEKQSFDLKINGFGVFESSRTLYLGISPSQAVTGIQQNLRPLLMQHFKRKLKSFSISDSPHMTISKTTGKKMLYESLKYFQKKDYFEQMKVDHLTLVARAKYKTWDWEHNITLS